MSQVKSGTTVQMNYVYNGRGEQVRKFVDTTNTYSLYDDMGHWLGEYDNTGVPTQQVIWMDDLPIGVLVGATTAQKLHYIEADALGTPRVVVDPTRGASGTAVWNWDLQGEAFGTTAPNQNPDGDANQFVFNIRFPGQRYDAVSGLNYNYFRDYDPSTGRYSQSDPIGLAGGMSTYGYVGGNPLTRIDPNGLLQWTVLPTDVRNNAETGTRVNLYTGATAQTVFRENTLALTSINWDIGGQCTCGDDGNYSLNEFNVSFTPQVTLRRRYSSSRVSTAVRRNEQDHVNDFSAWANGARTNAEALETEFKSRRFSSDADCKNSGQDAMQQYLYDDILPALIESHRRWDVGNPPRHFVPN